MDEKTTIHWSGKGNYVNKYGEIRRATTEMFSYYCVSIAEIKRKFGVRSADVMDWVAVRNS